MVWKSSKIYIFCSKGKDSLSRKIIHAQILSFKSNSKFSRDTIDSVKVKNVTNFESVKGYRKSKMSGKSQGSWKLRLNGNPEYAYIEIVCSMLQNQ